MNCNIELTEIVQSEVARCFTLFNKPVPTYSIAFFDTGVKAGSCYTYIVNGVLLDAKLSFNTKLYERNKETFINTILHEIAHLIQRIYIPNAKQAHGPEWRNICSVIGCNGKTYHNYECNDLFKKKIKRHVYSCPSTTHILSTTLHNRVLNGKKYFCVCCKQQIQFKETKLISDK